MKKLSPWAVLAQAGIKAPTVPCPSCPNGVLQVVEATIVEQVHPGYHVADRPLPTREREGLMAACNACEYAVEVNL